MNKYDSDNIAFHLLFIYRYFKTKIMMLKKVLLKLSIPFLGFQYNGDPLYGHPHF